MLNETSKHLTKFRNTQRNFARKFVTPNEISFEISRDVSRNYAKFRTCQDNSASKFLRNFEFPSKYREFSPIFNEIRRNSSKFALIIFSQYCKSSLLKHQCTEQRTKTGRIVLELKNMFPCFLNCENAAN